MNKGTRETAPVDRLRAILGDHDWDALLRGASLPAAAEQSVAGWYAAIAAVETSGHDAALAAARSTERAEARAADDFAGNSGTAGAVAVNGAAFGTIGTATDADWFRTTLRAGARYAIRLNGTGCDALFDPLVELRRADGARLATDDDGGSGLNSLLVYTPAASGRYYVAARGALGAIGDYRLSVQQLDDYLADTSTPAGIAVNGPQVAGRIDNASDGDWFRTSLYAGVTYAIRLNGTASSGLADPLVQLRNANGGLIAANDDGGDGLNSLLVYTPTQTGRYFVAARGFGGATGNYRVSVRAVDDFPGGTTTSGTVTPNAPPVDGFLESAGDTDWFRVVLSANVTYTMTLEGSGAGGIDDPLLELRNSSGVIVTFNDDIDFAGGILDSQIVYEPTTGGNYYLTARGFGTETGHYLIAVENSDDYAADGTTTGSVAPGGQVSGTIEAHGDQDWFAMELTAGTAYTLTLKGAQGGGGTLSDPYLRGIYDAGGALIAGTANDDWGGTRDSQVIFTPGATGSHYAAAGAYGSAAGSYTLAVVAGGGVADIADSTATVATLAVGETATSTIDPAGDVDWFRVSLVDGERYVIEENADASTGAALGDPFFRGIYDADGVAIPDTSSDDYGVSLDSRVSFTAPSTGTFYLAAGGFDDHTGGYSLSLATVGGQGDAIAGGTSTTGALAINGGAVEGTIDFARDIDWYRVTLQAGREYVVDARGAPSANGTLADPRLVGIHDAAGQILAGTGNSDGSATLDAQTVLRAPTAGTYYVAVAADNDGTGTYAVSIESRAATPDIPDNATTATSVAAGGSLSSWIETPADVDWIRVPLTGGVTYRIDQQGAATAHGTLADPRIAGVFDSRGGALVNSGNDNNGTNADARVTLTAPGTETFFIAAAASGDGTGSYRVLVTPLASDVTAPLLGSTNPADGATGVPRESNLSLSFNEAVQAGSGNIVITGGGQTLQIPVTDTNQVAFRDETVTINPSVNLIASASYSVRVASGVIADIAGNPFAGVGAGRLDFTTAAAGGDQWTIMVYVAADNNLESFALDDLNEMEAVTLPASVNVVTFVDRISGYSSASGNWTDTRRGAIVHDTNTGTVTSPLVSVGEQNTGSGTTLTGFVDWASATYPAQRYALVVWDHGGGLSGTAWDDTSNGDNLRPAELVQAIAATDVGHFDLIGFDACLQGLTEQYIDLAGLTDVVVASQELEPGDGWEYDLFLGDLAANPGMTATDLGAAIVTRYGQHYAGQEDITLTAVRTNALGAVVTAIDQFVAAVGGGGANLAALRTSAGAATVLHDGSQDYRDLGDFMDEVVARVGSTAIRAAATAVATAVDNAVIAHSGTEPAANGMSIYLPFGSDAVMPSYTAANYALLADSNWENFLAVI